MSMKTEFLNGKDIPEVSNVEVSLGVNNLNAFPPYEDIPIDIKMGKTEKKWGKLFNDWFFVGLKKLEVIPKEGVDKEKALRYIRAHMKSFSSKHEHKEYGLIWVMSLWFEDATWETYEKEK